VAAAFNVAVPDPVLVSAAPAPPSRALTAPLCNANALPVKTPAPLIVPFTSDTAPTLWSNPPMASVPPFTVTAPPPTSAWAAPSSSVPALTVVPPV
jgi:hypothetical protein